MTPHRGGVAAMNYPDQVRWFEHLAKCSCGKPSTGTLRGPRNESYGTSCERCATKRIAAAKQARDVYKAAGGEE